MPPRSSHALPLYPHGVSRRGPVLADRLEYRPVAHGRYDGWITLLLWLASSCIAIAAFWTAFHYLAPPIREIWRSMPLDRQFGLVLTVVFVGLALAFRSVIGLLVRDGRRS